MSCLLYRHIAVSVRCVILMSCIASSCYSANALAAESAEVQELKLQVAVLKKRVQELELVKVGKAKTVKGAGDRWRSLQVGMSKIEVVALLGKPGKVHKWKTGEAWYYPNSKGGEVDFDRGGKVSGWLEP